MKIERSTVTKLLITDLLNSEYRLDPVTVYAENFGNAQGKILIECYGKAWACYWGAMGDGTLLEDFFLSVGTDYIINCLVPGIEVNKYDPSQAQDRLKETIIKRRRLLDNWYFKKDWNYDSLDKQEARELWNRLEDEHFYDDPAGNSDIICAIEGHDEWWNALPMSPNPDYGYLKRIVEAVKASFKSLKETT